MTISENVFLTLLSSAVRTGQTVTVPPIAASDWNSVFRLAESHHVLPLIADAAYRSGLPVPEELFRVYRHRAMRMVSIQTAKTAAFAALYSYLAEQGLQALVVKGVVCRDLYPNPDFRFSADEDLLIREEEAERYHAALKAYGLRTECPEDEITSSFEVGYFSQDRLLYLEVHHSLFAPDSEAYGEYNELFRNAYENAVSAVAGDVTLKTLSPTDHLLYLICHALKHFLHGGFGIRQVCDICLYAEKYGGKVDWDRLTASLKAIRGDKFTAALLSIGERYLGIPVPWTKEEELFPVSEADPEELLADILGSGVYGSSTLSRKHSSNITLSALKEDKNKKSGRRSRLRILFPPAESLKGKYPYLKKYPILLPSAWVQRIFGYLRKTNRSDNSAKEALRLGRERKELLRKYGVTGTVERGEESETRKRDGYTKLVDTGTYISSLMEVVQEGHEVSLPVVGSSMTPFLGDGRDRVFLRKAEGKLKKGDVVLYRRVNGDYVLHRICRVRRNKHNDNNNSIELYDIVGDAQTRIERDVRREQIFAKVTRIERKGKLKTPGNVYWLFFQYIWVNIIPMRHLILRVYTAIR